MSIIYWPYGARYREEEVLKKFEKAGAVSKKTKKTPEEAGIDDTLATWISPPVRRGELIEVTENGKKYYYLPSKEQS